MRTQWIADLSTDSTKWEIYDPSYGAAPYLSNSPYSNNLIDVSKYEKSAVKDFSYEDLDTSAIVDLPAGSTPTEPPHIQGEVLWKP